MERIENIVWSMNHDIDAIQHLIDENCRTQTIHFTQFIRKLTIERQGIVKINFISRACL